MTSNKEFKSNPSAQATPKMTATTKVVSSDGEEAEMATVISKGKGKEKSRKENLTLPTLSRGASSTFMWTQHLAPSLATGPREGWTPC
jgi:hypothetical protein